MPINRKSKAQSMLEYVVLLSIIGVALGVMQLYFRRSIQGVVKLSCDQAGAQRNGGVDYDYSREWKIKGNSVVTSVSSASKTASRNASGAVTSATTQQD
jgi:hypothetical protein